MKKVALFMLALFASLSLSFAKSVPLSTAKTIGYNFLNQKNGGLKSADELNLVYTSGSPIPYFYVFSSSHSFVLVTADDGVVPILGYSTEGAFITNNISRNITGFFEDYNKQVDYVIKNNVPATSEIAAQRDDLFNNRVNSRNAQRTTDVSPMLTTTWDQAPYYNGDCPSDASGQAVTGCVATATAQVMKFWNWPTTGIGSLSYSTASYGTLSANFAATTYDWTSMPNSISGPNASIARLMSDVGISVEMDYSATESASYAISSATGTPPYCAEYSLKTFFNYDPTLHGEQRSDYADATWISMLETDLTAGHPIIYTGQGTAGGHCFVFDGYESSGDMFHVNWGWSGMDDGYYTIDALNPPSLGTGGGAGGFNSDQQAILGIKPIGVAPPSTGLALANPVTPSLSTIGYTQPFSVTTSIYNGGTTAFSGFYTAFVFDTYGTLIDSVQVLSGSLAVGATSSLLTFNTSTPVGLVPMLAGNYTVSIYARTATGGWSLVSDGSYVNSASMTVSNSAPIELYDNLTVTIPSTGIMVQGSPASVTTNFANFDVSTFAGSLEVVLIDLTGAVVATIQTMSMASTPLPVGDDYSSDLTFSTTNVTASPGTYLLTAAYTTDGVTWYYAGADYFQNPVYVTVVAPPPSPDIYEVNNTVAEAYDLTSTLSWVSNVASTGTPGSNFHITSDQDYYKINLAAGYHYVINARVNDEVSSDDGITYTTDAVWSYSIDNGAHWSTVYDDVMTGPDSIYVGGTTGGTVIFHASPHYGAVGTYLLKISSIKRTSVLSVNDPGLENARIFPNPASEEITVDLSGTGANGTEAILFDMQGRKVYDANVSNQSVFRIPVNSLAAGMYFIQVATDAGMINKKITVSSK